MATGLAPDCSPSKASKGPPVFATVTSGEYEFPVKAVGGGHGEDEPPVSTDQPTEGGRVVSDHVNMDPVTIRSVDGETRANTSTASERNAASSTSEDGELASLDTSSYGYDETPPVFHSLVAMVSIVSWWWLHPLKSFGLLRPRNR